MKPKTDLILSTLPNAINIPTYPKKRSYNILEMVGVFSLHLFIGSFPPQLTTHQSFIILFVNIPGELTKGHSLDGLYYSSSVWGLKKTCMCSGRTGGREGCTLNLEGIVYLSLFCSTMVQVPPYLVGEKGGEIPQLDVSNI